MKNKPLIVGIFLGICIFVFCLYLLAAPYLAVFRSGSRDIVGAGFIPQLIVELDKIHNEYVVQPLTKEDAIRLNGSITLLYLRQNIALAFDNRSTATSTTYMAISSNGGIRQRIKQRISIADASLSPDARYLILKTFDKDKTKIGYCIREFIPEIPTDAPCIPFENKLMRPAGTKTENAEWDLKENHTALVEFSKNSSGAITRFAFDPWKDAPTRLTADEATAIKSNTEMTDKQPKIKQKYEIKKHLLGFWTYKSETDAKKSMRLIFPLRAEKIQWIDPEIALFKSSTGATTIVNFALQKYTRIESNGNTIVTAMDERVINPVQNP